MPASKKKKPGPEGPGPIGNPRTSEQTPADYPLNQPIAGAGSCDFTVPDGVLEPFEVPSPDTNTPFQPVSATYSNEKAVSGPNDDWSTPDCATGLISRRDFTDVTGRPVHVLVIGAYDAGVRRAWVHRNLAQALARLSADGGSGGGSAVGAGAPTEPPVSSSGAAVSMVG